MVRQATLSRTVTNTVGSIFGLASSAFPTQDINDIGGGEPLQLAQTVRHSGGSGTVACHSVRICIYRENALKFAFAVAFACRSASQFQVHPRYSSFEAEDPAR